MTAGRGSVRVFAVEDTTVQLTWRGLPAGVLALRVDGTDVTENVSVDGGPGAVVLSGLPAGRDLKIIATPPWRNGNRVMLRARTLDALPGEELARIATIGDLHLGTTVFGHQGTITEVPKPAVPHPVRCAVAAIDEATAWGAQRLVVKGDVTDRGQVEQWRTYADLVGRTSIGVDAVPGNHDRAFRPTEAGLTPEAAAQAFALSMASPILVRDLDGLRLVLVDSTTGGRNIGRVEPATSEVVDAVSDADPRQAVVVVLHHHLQPHAVSEGWPIGVTHGESLDLLRRVGAVHPGVLVTSGHTHRHRRWTHGGATTTQVGSTKDYPGVWAGYVAHEGGLRQVVRRVARPDCMTWTDHTRRAALGGWRWVAPGALGWRCFNLTWPVR